MYPYEVQTFLLHPLSRAWFPGLFARFEAKFQIYLRPTVLVLITVLVSITSA